MAAYLIVDVDDLVEHFRRRGATFDLQEAAIGLRGSAALAAGLADRSQLRAVAAADWDANAVGREAGSVDPRYIFKKAGYETFPIPRAQRAKLADALVQNYFSFDPDPVDELILVTTNPDLAPLLQRVTRTRQARARIWGVQDVMDRARLGDDVIFQPLDTLLGIQQTKNVALYIDFENISISLNENGYTVNLDELIESFAKRSRAHGNVVKAAAYAPWGQRGSLPPMIDRVGREVADESPSKLMMANIDPVFNLPGKNSADMRIAKDIITDSGHSDAADIYIVASGDRDFKDVINSLRARNKQVILWAVRGAISQMLENYPGVVLEYVEDFTNLRTHQELSFAQPSEDPAAPMAFTPSQWSSAIIQFDQVAQALNSETLVRQTLLDRLIDVGAVISRPRAEDLVTQATVMGLYQAIGAGGARLRLNPTHPIVERTRLIRDRIVTRVMNTLGVRGWEYVNYGFLLKGLAMDRDLERPGMNYSDQWRSEWIDCLVREHLLVRELVPHRNNPDDLVPVIKLPSDYTPVFVPEAPPQPEPTVERDDEPVTGEPAPPMWAGVTLADLERDEPETFEMMRRVVVSVEQFTSFRGFEWCPLGSLHRRLRPFDRGMAFQRAVEYLVENAAASVNEYANPQSEFLTKGILLFTDAVICRTIIAERNAFVRLLLQLYERNVIISEQSVRISDPNARWNIELWLSIMETENILNPVPGRGGQYSLFRTHHTVALVADGSSG